MDWKYIRIAAKNMAIGFLFGSCLIPLIWAEIWLLHWLPWPDCR